MKTSRISGAIVATLALTAAGTAYADPSVATNTATYAKLSAYSQIWITAESNPETLGPVQNGLPRIGQKTGAGVMDTHFAWNQQAFAANPAQVQIATSNG